MVRRPDPLGCTPRDFPNRHGVAGCGAQYFGHLWEVAPVNAVEHIEDLAGLLAIPGVVEELELRSTLGVCALHGGGLERATEAVAREVAERTGASYYAVVQPEGSRHHLSSTRFDPKGSSRLAA